MKNQVELLAHQTVQKLSQQLVASPQAAFLKTGEIVQIIAEVIQHDYKSCKRSLRQDFYKKLSLLLHSDRFARDSEYLELATYLNEKKLLDEPQKILNECYTRESAESIFTFFKNVFSKPSQSLDILTRRISDNPLVSNLQRYPDPVKLGAILLLTVSVASYSVITILSMLGSAITCSLINATNNLIILGLNKVTDNRYEQMTEYYNVAAEHIVHERIQKGTLGTLDKVKLAFLALYAAGIDVNKNALQRATPLIASPFVLAGVALGDAALWVQRWFFTMVDAANLVSCYVAFTALNVPLISYDASVSLFEYLLDTDIVDQETSATKSKKTPLYLLFDSPVNTVGSLNSEVEPVHISSPIKYPLKKTDVQMPIEDTLNYLVFSKMQ
ncbi:hypothetical protein [Legionella rowbothamii]|uniref:hypothetical protein n=1 Tax=Legionella rowbothamii TaxID=96229 RepID=UPI0010560D75|nr:hypothetical protein [Legionella rowbothamii]